MPAGQPRQRFDILVRLVTNDELAQGNKCMVGHIVLCELVWVLQRLYCYSLQQCRQTMGSLTDFGGLWFEALPVVLAACKAWEKYSGDWAHHLLGAQMLSLGCEAAVTLDKAADRTSKHRKL